MNYLEWSFILLDGWWIKLFNTSIVLTLFCRIKTKSSFCWNLFRGFDLQGTYIVILREILLLRTALWNKLFIISRVNEIELLRRVSLFGRWWNLSYRNFRLMKIDFWPNILFNTNFLFNLQINLISFNFFFINLIQANWALSIIYLWILLIPSIHYINRYHIGWYWIWMLWLDWIWLLLFVSFTQWVLHFNS